MEVYVGVRLRVLVLAGEAAVVDGPQPLIQTRDRKARKWNGVIIFFIVYLQIKAAIQSAVPPIGRLGETGRSIHYPPPMSISSNIPAEDRSSQRAQVG
jgi:hypothetical protein